MVVARYTFLDSKEKHFGRGHSVIRILPEVKTEGMTKDNLNELVDRVQTMMQAEFDKLNDEMAAKESKKLH